MNKGLILSSVDWCNILSGPILNIYFLYLECSLNLERDALYLDNAQHHNLSDRIRVYILKRESKISDGSKKIFLGGSGNGIKPGSSTLGSSTAVLSTPVSSTLFFQC